MRAESKKGTIVRNVTKGTWNLLYYAPGSNRRTSIKIGNLDDFVDERVVRREADRILEEKKYRLVTMAEVVKAWRGQVRVKVPGKANGHGSITRGTLRTYESHIRNYVLPRWGTEPVAEFKAKKIKYWLENIDLAGPTKSTLKKTMSMLLNKAMYEDWLPVDENPVRLCKMDGLNVRKRGKPRSLSLEQFNVFIHLLDEPFRTLEIISLGVGLRISEARALQWLDVDWLERKLLIRRRIYQGEISDLKTEDSEKDMPLAEPFLLQLAKWHGMTLWPQETDWVFASPANPGSPWSYEICRGRVAEAAKAAGLEGVSTHNMRHTLRFWMAKYLKVDPELQSIMMRHALLQTTQAIYGKRLLDTDDEEREVAEGIGEIMTGGGKVQ